MPLRGHSPKGRAWDQYGREHARDPAHHAADPALATTARGIWAIKWSFAGLFLTAVFQFAVAMYSGSMALLADTIHNFGDATTSIPLWIAFALARRKATTRFTYGYGRVEDVAGVIIVLTILFSAVAAGYESVRRLMQPHPVEHLGAIAVASLLGFAGNEAVAVFRIRTGREIHSSALIADGYHARVDGLASLAVLLGVAGIHAGYPVADPIVGLVISLVILRIVWESSKAVIVRLMDGVDPETIQEIRYSASHVEQVRNVSEVRVRWSGHRLNAELNVAVDPRLSVAQAHAIALDVRHHLLHSLPYLSNVTIHIDPENASGEAHHLDAHSRDV